MLWSGQGRHRRRSAGNAAPRLISVWPCSAQLGIVPSGCGLQRVFGSARLNAAVASRRPEGGPATPVTFSAFGPTGTLLFTTTVSGFADSSNNGETAEDRFFGVTNAAGISAIFMSNASGGMEVDHLQYGAAAVNAVQNPRPTR